MTASPIRLFPRRLQPLHAWGATQSTGFVGRGECRSARDHNATAEQVDATADLIIDRLGRMVGFVRNSRSADESRNMARLMELLLVEFKRLDSLEDWQRRANDADLAQDDACWGQIIDITESQLVQRSRKLRPCEIEAELDGLDGDAR